MKSILVMTASNAEQAFEILEHIKVDMVISDQKMPGIKGVQLLKTIRLKYPDICQHAVRLCRLE